MRIRVLWVIKGLGPGGAEQLLVEAARAHDAERFQIECVFVRPDKDHLADDLEAAGVATRCIGLGPGWPRRLSNEIRRGDFDIVHVHSPSIGSVARLATRAIPDRRRPAIVTTEHNATSTYHPITRIANGLTGRWDAASIAVSDEARHSIRTRVERPEVTIVHGIDVAAVARHRDGREAVRDELGIETHEIVIGTIANFREQKDYPTLFTAMRVLGERGVKARLVAIGQGPLENDMRSLVADLGLADRVTLTGHVADAARVLAVADVFVLASRWEGLPVALMEALALGLPVVCTDVGGLAEHLVHEHDALLVPPGSPSSLADALERVIEDIDLRASLGMRSSELALRYDVRRSAVQIEQIYEAAVRPGRIRTPLAVRHPPPSHGEVPGIDIRAVTPQDRSAIMELGRRCLGWRGDQRDEWLFAWKHDHNPFGPSPGWVAVHDGRIVGVRMLMRWNFRRDGQILRAVRAVDTATDPDFAGRGIFSALTVRACDEVAADGIEFVFNTPNDQSRPGYLKMGWQVVGALPTAAIIRPRSLATVARSRRPADLWSQPLTIGRTVADWLDGRHSTHCADAGGRRLRTSSTIGFLRWRYGQEVLGYRAIDVDDGTLIVRARTRGNASELVLADHPGLSVAQADREAGRVLRESGCDHLLRLGTPNLARGFIPIPVGPTLTWRALGGRAMPPLPNWDLRLGDVELF